MSKYSEMVERYETCINALQWDDKNGQYYEILEEAEGDYTWATQSLADWLNQMISEEYEEISDSEVIYYTELLRNLYNYTK